MEGKGRNRLVFVQLIQQKSIQVSLLGCFFIAHFVFPSENRISFLIPHAFRFAVITIYVNQDDHTFIFSSNLAGEIIEVMGSDGLLYTSIIGENGKVVVPNSITGEVELRLYRGDLVYSAIVEL